MQLDIIYSTNCSECEYVLDIPADREIWGDMVYITTGAIVCPNCNHEDTYSTEYPKDQH